MSDIYSPTGKIYRGDSAEIRLAVIDRTTSSFVERGRVMSIRAELWRDAPSPKQMETWHLDVEETLSDGPITHAQDAGWPYSDIGYNFRWRLPRGYTTEAPSKYRVLICLEMVGLEQSTHVVKLEVLDPNHGA